MYTEQDLQNLLRVSERLLAYRPYFRNKGESYEESSSGMDRQSMPWEGRDKVGVHYRVYLGNISVLSLVEIIHKNQSRKITQGEAMKLNGVRTNLCVFDVDYRGKLIRDSFKLVPLIALLGMIFKNTTQEYELDESVIASLNKKFSDEYQVIQTLNFEMLGRLYRDIFISTGFSFSHLKRQKLDQMVVYIDEIPLEKSSYGKTTFLKHAREVMDKAQKEEGAELFETGISVESDFSIDLLEKMMHSKDLDALSELIEPDGVEIPKFPYFSKLNNIGIAPMGKWPSSRPLDLYQQYMVNYLSEKPEGTCLKIAETPAGTDRESIIKALAAVNIVKKAAFLADVEKPNHFFEKADDKNTKFYRMPTELIETELLVLTDNEHKAVDLSYRMSQSFENNMTGLFDVTDKEYGTVNDIYYTRGAQAIFQTKESWGMPAIPILSSGDMSQMINLLYSNINALQKNFRVKKSMGRLNFIAIRDLCESFFRKFSSEMSWNKMRSEYKDLYQEVETLHDQLAKEYSDICQIPKKDPDDLQNELVELDGRLTKLEERYKEHTESIEQMQHDLDVTENAAEDLFDSMNSREQHFYKVMKSANTNKYNSLLNKAEDLKNSLEEKKQELLRMEKLRERTTDRYQRCIKELENAVQWEKEQEQKLFDFMEAHPYSNGMCYRDLKSIYQYLFTDMEVDDPYREAGEAENQKDETNNEMQELIDKSQPTKPELKIKRVEKERMLTPPFATAHYIELSERLLFKSLQLIKFFVQSSDCVKDNINLFLKNLRNDTMNELSPEMYTHSLAALQLMFPVMVIPKDHCVKMLSPAEKKNIGTLLIADAGLWRIEEAVPYLNTAMKVVLMGDRLSEKISGTLPYFAEDIIYDSCEFPEDMVYKGQSVLDFACQGLEKSPSRLMISHDNDYAIVNFLNKSYNNRLIYVATLQERPFTFPNSRFMDVNGRTIDKDSYYVDEQGKVVISLLNSMIGAYGVDFFKTPNKEFYILSPFQSVVDGLRSLINAKLLSILPETLMLLHDKKMKSIDVSNFLYRFKNENILTLNQYNTLSSAREIVLVLGGDKTSYNCFVVGNYIAPFNRMFSNVYGHVTIIGNSAVWEETEFFRLINRDFEFVEVK